MDFGEVFIKDLSEAFDFYIEKQLIKYNGNLKAIGEIENLIIEQWVVSLLSQPVYELIREKRVKDAKEA